MRPAAYWASRERSSLPMSMFQNRWRRAPATVIAAAFSKLYRPVEDRAGFSREGKMTRARSGAIWGQRGLRTVASQTSVSLTEPATTRLSALLARPLEARLARAFEAEVGLTPDTRAAARLDSNPSGRRESAARTRISSRFNPRMAGTKPRRRRNASRSSLHSRRCPPGVLAGVTPLDATARCTRALVVPSSRAT